jgi:hypothetical protein
VEEDGIDFCFGAGTCGSGCHVAFFVSDDVAVGIGRLSEKRTARNGCATSGWRRG